MFAIRTTTGSRRAVTQTACGRSARAIRRATIACSSRSLSLRSSCSPRWSSTAGSALRRVDPASASVRRAAPRGAPAAPGSRPRTSRRRGRRRTRSRTGTPRAATPSTARGVVVARRVHLDLARQHDLLELARADPLDGARHGPLVVLGRHRADDAVAARRRRVEQRQRRRAQLARAAPDAREQVLGGVVGRRERGERQAHLAAAPGERDLGHDQRRRREPSQCGDAAPSRANANPPTATSPAPGGPSGGSATASRPAARHARATALKALGAGRLERSHAAERRERAAVAVGLLEAEPRLARPARGEDDARVGSTSASTRDRDAASAARRCAARAPHARARAARSQRARARRASSHSALARGRMRRELMRGRRPAAQVSLRPRAMAISPVRAISIRPNGRTMRSNASILSSVPGDLDDHRALGDVDDLAAEDLAHLHDLRALRAVGGDLEQRELARDRLVAARGRGS